MFTNLNLDASLISEIEKILERKNADALPQVFVESARKAAEESKKCICLEERQVILRKYFKKAQDKFDGKITESLIRGFQSYFDSLRISGEKK